MQFVLNKIFLNIFWKLYWTDFVKKKFFFQIIGYSDGSVKKLLFLNKQYIEDVSVEKQGILCR